MICVWMAVMSVMKSHVIALPPLPANNPATQYLWRNTNIKALSQAGSQPEKPLMLTKAGLLSAYFLILRYGLPRSSGMRERHDDVNSLTEFQKSKQHHSTTKGLSTKPYIKTTAQLLDCNADCSNTRFMREQNVDPLIKVQSSKQKRGLSINHDLQILSKILKKSRKLPPKICHFSPRFRLLKDIQRRIKTLYGSKPMSSTGADYKARVSQKYNDYNQSKIANMLIELGK